MMNNFKVGGFKVFGDIVELNMIAGTKNTTHLNENLIERKINNLVYKNLKTAIIYGGNNTGKSSLLDALWIMKKIFKRGDVENFPFEVYKNFCFNHDDILRFEVDFNGDVKNYVYGIEFKNEKFIGEYLYINDELFFSRDLDDLLEGALSENSDFSKVVDNLPSSKLIIPYFLEYQKDLTKYQDFIKVKEFFDKLVFVDNRRNDINLSVLVKFMEDKKKVKILNELINSTELYLNERIVISEEDLLKDEIIRELLKDEEIQKLVKTDDAKEDSKDIINSFRVTSVYKGKGGKLVNKPSIFFDSVGTNKYLNLSMIIINALMDGKILLIDEFDSSLHHKLTRVLVILMNSEANKESQFIMTTHDVNLLSNNLFRKDQINFIIRDEEGVEIVSLDDFKANSEIDVRNTSNFEKMYVEEKIVPLPETDIYNVIKELLNE